VLFSETPYRQHLSRSSDLMTPYENIRAGFVALALERNRRATPFVEQARALRVAAFLAAKPQDLLGISEIRLALLSAAGVSDKAAGHMEEQDKAEAVQGLIRNFLEPAGSAFVEELVYRFLLTRGDTLGGSMRNVGGILAQRKLARAMISTLTLSKVPFQWLHATNNTWAQARDDNADMELYLRGISWSTGDHNRTIILNLKVPLVRNNVDLCLFDCAHPEIAPALLKSPQHYVALGELKGGIDPAGADEHWKTARTALDRIRKAFAARDLKPHTFFVGAAIESKMAEEIWEQLEQGSLSNAANLTDTRQVASIARWLCNL
jgi:hypothetical protein